MTTRTAYVDNNQNNNHNNHNNHNCHVQRQRHQPPQQPPQQQQSRPQPQPQPLPPAHNHNHNHHNHHARHPLVHQQNWRQGQTESWDPQVASGKCATSQVDNGRISKKQWKAAMKGDDEGDGKGEKA